LVKAFIELAAERLAATETSEDDRAEVDGTSYQRSTEKLAGR
jgi:hypothetical protein